MDVAARARRDDASAERLPLLAIILQAAILPLLGIPIWFRNEAPFHYLYCRETRFLDSWKTYTPAINRPVVRFVEWIECHAFGTNASLYVLFNGLLFVLFVVVLARLAAALFGRTAGWLSVLALLAAWSLVFYPLYNAIHGVEYPLELLLATGAVAFFHAGLRGDPRRFAIGALLALLAAFTHSMSLVVLPVVFLAAVFLAPERPALLGARGRLAVLLLAPCALLLMPVVQGSGAPGGILAQGGIGGSLRFALAQAAALDAFAMRAPGGPIVLWGALFLALGGTAPRLSSAGAAGPRGDEWGGSPSAPSRQSLALAAGTLVLAIALSVAGPRVPLARLAVLIAALVVAAARDRRLAFLVVWAIAGAGLFLLTPERNASYYRHLAAPTAILSAAALASMLDAVARARATPAALRRSVTLPRAALATAVLSVAILLAARAAPVPFLSAKLEDIEYVKDLSFTFRDLVTQVAGEAAVGDTLLMFRGPTREEESRDLYGRGYLDRLQPSKFAYYEWYFRLLGRDDLRVAAVEDAARNAGPARGRRVLAVNAWETERVIADLGLRPAREFRRGRARAALFGP